MTNDSPVIRCPSCGARDVRPSFSHGLWDTVMSAFGRSPMRCRQCQRRFHPRPLRKDEDTEDQPDVKESNRN